MTCGPSGVYDTIGTKIYFLSKFEKAYKNYIWMNRLDSVGYRYYTRNNNNSWQIC